MLKLKLFLQMGLLMAVAMLVGCKPSEKEGVVRVGTIAGPETELMEIAKTVAKKKYNLDVQIVTFEDYITPNAALNDGQIDANAFQTFNYFEEALLNTGYHLANAGYTFIYPMGIYSKKYTSLKALPQGAKIAIPNDPSNMARSLLMLEDAGIIQIKMLPHQNDLTLETIVSNPHKIEFVELDAAQLPRVLDDVDAAAINTNYALPAGLLPKRDAIYVESVKPIYANIIVVKAGHEKDPRIAQLVASYQSDEVVARADKLFSGQAIPAWKSLPSPVK